MCFTFTVIGFRFKGFRFKVTAMGLRFNITTMGLRFKITAMGLRFRNSNCRVRGFMDFELKVLGPGFNSVSPLCWIVAFSLFFLYFQRLLRSQSLSSTDSLNSQSGAKQSLQHQQAQPPEFSALKSHQSPLSPFPFPLFKFSNFWLIVPLVHPAIRTREREQLVEEVKHANVKWRSIIAPRSISTVPDVAALAAGSKEAFLKAMADAVLSKRKNSGASQDEQGASTSSETAKTPKA